MLSEVNRPCTYPARRLQAYDWLCEWADVCYESKVLGPRVSLPTSSPGKVAFDDCESTSPPPSPLRCYHH